MKIRHNYDTNSIQERLLLIIKEVDRVCKEHNLRYYIWAGTQLGAVRHKGFIPWDDDADIAMPRADYNKLMEHASEWLPEPLEMANLHTVGRLYPHYFARVQDASTTMVIRKHLGYVEGIHIDIFPLDNVPNSKSARRIHFARLERMYRLLYIASRSIKKDSKLHKRLFYGFMQLFVDRKRILEKIDKFIQRHNDKECTSCTDSFYGSDLCIAYDTLGTPTPYEFAGVELMGVENADRCLTERYGDYMTLPPLNDRRQHSVDFLDYDRPYREFDIKELL